MGDRAAVMVSERVVNERRDGCDDPHQIGTARSGLGTPLTVLRADGPVNGIVARAFVDGLAARGLDTSPGGVPPYVLAATIHECDANQHARREAAVDFSVVLSERATGRTVWLG